MVLSAALVTAARSRSITVNTTRYTAAGSDIIATVTTEAQAQTKLRTAGTFSHLSAIITANTLDVSLTIRSRLNTANGGMSMSVGAGLTGEFTDASNSDAVVATDVYCYQWTSGAGSGAATITVLNAVFTATTNTANKILSNGTSSLSTGTTYYLMPSGAAGNATTESGSQIKIEAAGTLSNLHVRVNAFSGTNDTLTVRKNTADGNQTISISGTGFFEDTSNTDTIAAGDLLAYKFITGTGAPAIAQVGCDFTTTSSTWLTCAGHAAGQTINASATQYAPVGGDLRNSLTATEADVKMTSRLAFTAGNLGINITANTISAASTALLRVNGANSALSASITASTTGIFEDLSNAVTILATDQINFAITGGGTGTSLTATAMWMLGNSMTLDWNRPTNNLYVPRTGVVAY